MASIAECALVIINSEKESKFKKKIVCHKPL